MTHHCSSRTSQFRWIALIGAILVVAITVALVTDQQLTKKQRDHESYLDQQEAESYHLYVDGADGIDGLVRNEEDWQSLVGFWEGILVDELRILFRITAVYGQVFTYSLDQGGMMIPASATHFDPQTQDLRFYFPTIDGVYSASLNEGWLVGTWKQHGTSNDLDMQQWAAPDDANPKPSDIIPREYRFLQEKIVSGYDVAQLQQMVGFWSGYLDDNLDDDDDNQEPIFVVLQIEQVASDLVEPKLFSSDYDSRLPFPIRSFIVNRNSEVKIVSDFNVDQNAIFQGRVDYVGNSTRQQSMTGKVYYDDTDSTPPLTLVWSEEHPNLEW